MTDWPNGWHVSTLSEQPLLVWTQNGACGWLDWVHTAWRIHIVKHAASLVHAVCTENVLKVLANLSAEWLFKHVQTCKEWGTGCESREGKSLNRALPWPVLSHLSGGQRHGVGSRSRSLQGKRRHPHEGTSVTQSSGRLDVTWYLVRIVLNPVTFCLTFCLHLESNQSTFQLLCRGS